MRQDLPEGELPNKRHAADGVPRRWRPAFGPVSRASDRERKLATLTAGSCCLIRISSKMRETTRLREVKRPQGN